MPGKRMIHDNALRSKKLNSVSLGAGELWFRILLLVDDNGNYFGDRLVIYANAMRSKAGVTAAMVGRFVEELIKIGLLEEYTVPEEDQPYIHVVNFHEYQAFKTDRPVKVTYPVHPQGPYFSGTGKTPLTERDGTSRDTQVVQNGSTAVPVSIPEVEVEVKGQGEVEEEASTHREGSYNKFREAFKDALGRATKPKPYPKNVERYQELCGRFGEEEVLDAINALVALHGKAALYKNKFADSNFLFDEAEDLIKAKQNGTLGPPEDEEISRVAGPRGVGNAFAHLVKPGANQ